MTELLIKNIAELVTNQPMAEKSKITQLTDDDLGVLNEAWLHIFNGKVKNFGDGEPPQVNTHCNIIDANGCLIIPGLIDCHTHPVFCGDRSDEFYQRLNGISYSEIANQGGGIKASVKFTREASYEALKKQTKLHLDYFLSFGVTTVEAKTGYGLSIDEELRHLRILNELKKEAHQTIMTTCLVLHAIPEEFDSEKIYVENIAIPLLEKAEKENLIDFVDAFIEENYFSVDGTKDFFHKGKKGWDKNQIAR